MPLRELHCEAWQADKWWVAQCLEVAIVAQGKTLGEATKNLDHSLQTHFRDIRKMKQEGVKVSPIPAVPFYLIRLAIWWLKKYTPGFAIPVAPILLLLRHQRLPRTQKQKQPARTFTLLTSSPA